MIEVGSLVTHKFSKGYRLTNNKSLCVVTSKNGSNSISVKIIASIISEGLGDEYFVIKSDFKEITISEYFDKYPNAYKCQNFNKILKEYNIEETINTYERVIPEEQKKELREEMISLLEEYGYHPTELGINKEIDE